MTHVSDQDSSYTLHCMASTTQTGTARQKVHINYLLAVVQTTTSLSLASAWGAAAVGPVWALLLVLAGPGPSSSLTCVALEPTGTYWNLLELS